MLQLIDAVEALGIDPADVAPDHWHHVHNRLSVSEIPRPLHEGTPSGLAPSAEGHAMTARLKTTDHDSAAACCVLPRRSSQRRHRSTSGMHPRAFRSASTAYDRRTSSYVTELLAVQPPEPLATFLDLNGYLPIGVPMLKRVLALPGQTVCRNGLTISSTPSRWARRGNATGEAVRSRNGRAVASSAEGEFFLMNWQSTELAGWPLLRAASASAVIGRAVPVWTNEE